MNPSEDLLTSTQACALLEVKRATLYSYVSRGLIRCVHRRGAKARHYVAEDVQRVAARSAARRGHAPVAAGALLWGEPVLDSSITSVGDRGIHHRGAALLTLVAAATPFEALVDRLWQAAPDEHWPTQSFPRVPRASGPPVARLVATVAAVARDAQYAEAPTHARARGRRLLWTFTRALAGDDGEQSIAGQLARRLPGARHRVSAHAQKRSKTALDAALVLSADHELNVSTFAARIAASAGADLVACVGAALYVFTGPKHGGACDRVEALLEAMPARRRERAGALKERLARGEALPGFGHPLYPRGDPRAAPLLAHARALGGDGTADEVAELVAEATGQHPTLDYGLVALTRALGSAPGTATALFALGRTSGWIAHALEQRGSAALLRPRARYVGPDIPNG